MAGSYRKSKCYLDFGAWVRTGAPVYDAAGEITTGTAGNVYLYDAEGRICAVATAGMDGMGPSMTGYVYDAAGNRVAKGPITKMSCDPTQNGFETSGEESDYIHNQSGQPVTKLTMDEGVMTWNYTNVYADGQLFATYDAQGLHFDLDDWLGTRAGGPGLRSDLGAPDSTFGIWDRML